MSFPPLPLISEFLENFCVALFTRVRAKSIKNYLCGVQSFAHINGEKTKIKDMVKLQYIIRGIKRSQGNWHKRTPKAPISMAQMADLVAHIRLIPNKHDRAMLTAAISIAFLVY